MSNKQLERKPQSFNEFYFIKDVLEELDKASTINDDVLRRPKIPLYEAPRKGSSE